MSSSDELEARIAEQEANLARQLEWVRAVDGKTPIVLGIATAMLGALAALATFPLSLADAGWVLFGGLLPAICIVQCALATFPRLDAPNESLIFFGTIAKLSPTEYAAKVAIRNQKDYFDDLLAQCHQNAVIANEKFRHTKTAVFCLLVGILLWLLAVSMLYTG